MLREWWQRADQRRAASPEHPPFRDKFHSGEKS
jgi:hypothetical protein